MKRNMAVDIAKAIAVLMMVFGHCIQYGGGSTYMNSLQFASNILYEYIYSFHMPLFAMLSGYLFYFSISKRDLKNIIKNRIINLLIPIFGWQLVISNFHTVVTGIIGGQLGIGLFIKDYFTVLDSMWFLWAILVCSSMVILVRYVFRDSFIVCILAVLASFCIKFDTLQMWLWLLPFFVIGYFANKYKSALSARVGRNYHVYAIVCIVIHLILVYFWKSEYYIYESLGGGLYIFKGKSIAYAIFANIYRIVIGFAGSIAWIYISHLISGLIKEKGWINRFAILSSKYSMGIYVISLYIFDRILRCMKGLHYNIFMVTLESLLIMFGSIVAMLLIDKWSITRRLLLGGRQR